MDFVGSPLTSQRLNRQWTLASRPHRKHLLWWSALALLTMLLLTVLAAGRAEAHSELLESNPANGAELAKAPAKVELVFNEEIIEAGSQLAALNAAGQTVTLPTPTILGSRLSAAWPVGTPGGTYRLSYRVTSADGHPINGTISFSYPEAAPSPSATVTSPTQATPQPVTPGATSATASPIPADPQSDSDGRSMWWLIAGLVVLGVIIGAVIARVMTKRRANSE